MFLTKISSNLSVSDKLAETTVLTPTMLEDLPDSLFLLRAMEATVIDLLISFHYRLDALKTQMMLAFEKGTTTNATNLWTERSAMYKKKRDFERHLEKIQQKIQEMKSNT